MANMSEYPDRIRAVTDGINTWRSPLPNEPIAVLDGIGGIEVQPRGLYYGQKREPAVVFDNGDGGFYMQSWGQIEAFKAALDKAATIAFGKKNGRRYE